MSVAWVLGVHLLTAASTAPEAPRLLIQEFAIGGGVDPAVATAIVEGVAPEIDRRGYFHSVTTKDVQTILGLERQKQLLGCAEASSCLTELAGALGSAFVLTGSISKIGGSLQLSMQMLDASKSQVVARSIRIARDAETLRQLLPWAIAEATATPAPPRPSRAPSIILISTGSVAAAVGIAVGAQALIQEEQYQHDLATGLRTTGLLEQPSYYQQKGDQLALQRTIGLSVLIGGAALIGAGIVLLPSGPSGEVSVSMLFTGSGVAFAGAF